MCARASEKEERERERRKKATEVFLAGGLRTRGGRDFEGRERQFRSTAAVARRPYKLFRSTFRRDRAETQGGN